jgi:tripartite-type tricarboxylate transporter receptor subunit TctC
MLKKLVLATILASATAAFAQSYPAKPVRLIVTFAAGGGADFVGRTVGGKLAEMLGQPVVVENRAGANGALGAELVAKSAPDGYTLLIGAAGTIAVAPHLNPKLPFDTFKDLGQPYPPTGGVSKGFPAGAGVPPHIPPGRRPHRPGC